MIFARMSPARTIAGGLLLAIVFGGCATPIANYTRNLCLPGAVAVTTRWDGQLHHVFERLWTAAGADIGFEDVAIVAVDGPASLPTAWTCGDVRRTTVAFTVRALSRLNTFPEPDDLVAITVAHELAHVVLHFRSLTKTTDTEEIEADTLGVYYFERAGYDCRRWARGDGYFMPIERRDAAAVACAGAKRGLRPPLPRRPF